MSFIRPEAYTGLKRWRGAVIAAAVLAWGLWWGLTGLGFVRLLGWMLVLVSGALVWAMVQRARFRGGHGGLGVVEVDERQIAYLAPVGGGMVSLEVLSEVALAPDRAGLPVWLFSAGGETLRIPSSAEGTDALFDALTALPGVDIEAAIRASRGKPDGKVVVWRRPLARL